MPLDFSADLVGLLLSIYIKYYEVLAMITKDQVISSLKDMPDQFSIDELMDKLILLQKIEKGLEQSKAGEVYLTGEAKEMQNLDK